MNSLRQILKYVDTRLLVIAGVILLAVFVINFVVLGNIRGRVDEASEILRTTQTEVSTLEAQVAGIRENGTGDLQQLVTQIAALEQAVPKDQTPLFATSTAARIASESGLQLLNFTEAEMGRTGPNAVPNAEITVGVLSARAYVYSVQGTFEQLLAFSNGVLADPTWVATIESAVIEAVEVPGLGDDEQDRSLTGTSVSMTGIILVWGLNVSPVIPPGDSATDPAAPVDPAAPAPSGVPAPVDPAAPAPSGVPAPVDPAAPAPSGAPAPVDPAAPAPSGVPVPAPSGATGL